MGPGADPGFRRGGGVRTLRRGGFVQEFQERIQIVAGSWANQQAKKIADSRGGGGGVRSPQKKPVSAHGAPRAPPGIFNDTYFVITLMVSSKQKYTLKLEKMSHGVRMAAILDFSFAIGEYS